MSVGSLNLTVVADTQSVGSEKGPRREWRRNKKGRLRGVCWRERKGRKVIKYVGSRNKPAEFKKILPEYEAWERANGIAL